MMYLIQKFRCYITYKIQDLQHDNRRKLMCIQKRTHRLAASRIHLKTAKIVKFIRFLYEETQSNLRRGSFNHSIIRKLTVKNTHTFETDGLNSVHPPVDL